MKRWITYKSLIEVSFPIRRIHISGGPAISLHWYAHFASISSCFFFSSSSYACLTVQHGTTRGSAALTFFIRWNRSRNEPSLENTLTGFGLGCAEGLDAGGGDPAATYGAGEAYPLMYGGGETVDMPTSRTVGTRWWWWWWW